MKKAIGILSYVYFVIFAVVWLMGMYGIFIDKGLKGVFSTLSPFNIGNYLVTILLLLPGYLLYRFSEPKENEIIDKKKKNKFNFCSP